LRCTKTTIHRECKNGNEEANKYTEIKVKDWEFWKEKKNELK
jgi:hypothetical protein